MTTTELRRLSELRSLLEGFAARHAARHAAEHAASSPETLGALRSILNRLTRAVRARDYEAFREADLELHETIVSLAGVPMLAETWRAA